MTDLLDEYRRKRDFALTDEPAPEDPAAEAPNGARRFVIQKHDASRLHYDFRLEIDGVLKSWAVPKGPSLNPKDRRLAMPTEDHPLSYRTFEGVIPEGQYGGGTVLLWDLGTFAPIDSNGEELERTDAQLVKDLEKGKLRIRLEGEKLHGGWSLVKMKGKASKKEEPWLLIKRDDDDADPSRDITEERPESVVGSGELDDIAEAAIEPPPERMAPTLCTLVKEVPEGDDWLHELKLDGYRLLCRVQGSEATLESRNHKDWTGKVGAKLRKAAASLADSAWIDGELVTFDAEGLTSFRDVRSAVNDGDTGRLRFMAFDLLFLEGVDLRDRPLKWRKAQLKKLLGKRRGPIGYVDHVEGGGQDFYRTACDAGTEGIVSKAAESPYEGKRSKKWLKIRCDTQQEMVVAGYTPSTASAQQIGSLVLAVRDGDEWKYSGRVGTGFTEADREELKTKLDGIARKTTPLVDPPRGGKMRDVTWVTPKLVAQVTFTEWTEEGRLRHPAFVGLRSDKRPEDVVREEPVAMREKQKNDEAKKSEGKGKGKGRKGDPIRVEGVRLTSPDKVLYPEAGFTKRDLAEHWVAVADRILPHVAERPLTFVRCPEGTGGQCFYQKHAMPGLPDAVKTLELAEKEGKGEYLYIEDVRGLVALAQLGVLELHLWGSRVDRPERVDRMVFDLDPAEGLGFEDVVRGAREVRDVLETLGLESFPMVTGGKGVHVVVPLDRHHDFDEVKSFSGAVAKRMTEASPDRYIAKASKQARKGLIFLDYLRNGRGATAIAPYSPRARAGAPVATPIRWDELGKMGGGDAYTMATLPRRLASLKKDPWADYFDTRQRITKEARDAILS